MEYDNLKKRLSSDKPLSIERLNQFSSILKEPSAKSRLAIINDLPKLIPTIVKYVFCGESNKQEAVVPAYVELTNLLDLNKHLKAGDWWNKFKEDIALQIEAMMPPMVTEDNKHWHIIWTSTVVMIGSELKKEVKVINRLLKVLEIAFKSQNEHLLIVAFKCWCEIIDNFAINKEEINNEKRLKLLITPLKASNHKTPAIYESKMKTWMHLLFKLDQNESTVDMVVLHFLEFMFVLGSKAPACQVLPHECANALRKLLKTPLIFEKNVENMTKYTLVALLHISKEKQTSATLWADLIGNLKHFHWKEEHIATVLSCINKTSPSFSETLLFPRLIHAIFVEMPEEFKVKHYKEMINLMLKPDFFQYFKEEWCKDLLAILQDNNPVLLPENIFGIIINSLISLYAIDVYREHKLKSLRVVWMCLANTLSKWMSEGFMGQKAKGNTEMTDTHQLLLFGCEQLNPVWNSSQLKMWKLLYSESVKYFSLSPEIECDSFVSGLIDVLLKDVRGTKIPLHVAIDVVTFILEIHFSKDVSPIQPLMMEVAEFGLSCLQLDGSPRTSDLLRLYLKNLVKATRTDHTLVNDVLAVTDKMAAYPVPARIRDKIILAVSRAQHELNMLKPQKSQEKSGSPNTPPPQPSSAPTVTSFLHRLAKAQETKAKMVSPTGSPSQMTVSPSRTPKSSKKDQSPFSDFQKENFVFVPPKNRKTILTDHQKESLTARKHDIPALYQDLSQDNSQSAYESIVSSGKTADKEIIVQSPKKKTSFADIRSNDIPPQKGPGRDNPSGISTNKCENKQISNKENDCLHNNSNSSFDPAGIRENQHGNDVIPLIKSDIEKSKDANQKKQDAHLAITNDDQTIKNLTVPIVHDELVTNVAVNSTSHNNNKNNSAVVMSDESNKCDTENGIDAFKMKQDPHLSKTTKCKKDDQSINNLTVTFVSDKSVTEVEGNSTSAHYNGINKNLRLSPTNDKLLNSLQCSLTKSPTILDQNQTLLKDKSKNKRSADDETEHGKCKNYEVNFSSTDNTLQNSPKLHSTPLSAKKRNKIVVSIIKNKKSLNTSESNPDQLTPPSKIKSPKTTPKISPRRLRKRKSGVTPTLSGIKAVRKKRISSIGLKSPVDASETPTSSKNSITSLSSAVDVDTSLTKHKKETDLDLSENKVVQQNGNEQESEPEVNQTSVLTITLNHTGKNAVESNLNIYSPVKVVLDQLITKNTPSPVKGQAIAPPVKCHLLNVEDKPNCKDSNVDCEKVNVTLDRFNIKNTASTVKGQATAPPAKCHLLNAEDKPNCKDSNVDCEKVNVTLDRFNIKNTASTVKGQATAPPAKCHLLNAEDKPNCKDSNVDCEKVKVTLDRFNIKNTASTVKGQATAPPAKCHLLNAEDKPNCKDSNVDCEKVNVTLDRFNIKNMASTVKGQATAPPAKCHLLNVEDKPNCKDSNVDCEKVNVTLDRFNIKNTASTVKGQATAPPAKCHLLNAEDKPNCKDSNVDCEKVKVRLDRLNIKNTASTVKGQGTATPEKGHLLNVEDKPNCKDSNVDCENIKTNTVSRTSKDLNDHSEPVKYTITDQHQIKYDECKVISDNSTLVTDYFLVTGTTMNIGNDVQDKGKILKPQKSKIPLKVPCPDAKLTMTRIKLSDESKDNPKTHTITSSLNSNSVLNDTKDNKAKLKTQTVISGLNSISGLNDAKGNDDLPSSMETQISQEDCGKCKLTEENINSSRNESESKCSVTKESSPMLDEVKSSQNTPVQSGQKQLKQTQLPFKSTPVKKGDTNKTGLVDSTINSENSKPSKPINKKDIHLEQIVNKPVDSKTSTVEKHLNDKLKVTMLNGLDGSTDVDSRTTLDSFLSSNNSKEKLLLVSPYKRQEAKDVRNKSLSGKTCQEEKLNEPHNKRLELVDIETSIITTISNTNCEDFKLDQLAGNTKMPLSPTKTKPSSDKSPCTPEKFNTIKHLEVIEIQASDESVVESPVIIPESEDVIESSQEDVIELILSRMLVNSEREKPILNCDKVLRSSPLKEDHSRFRDNQVRKSVCRRLNVGPDDCLPRDKQSILDKKNTQAMYCKTSSKPVDDVKELLIPSEGRKRLGEEDSSNSDMNKLSHPKVEELSSERISLNTISNDNTTPPKYGVSKDASHISKQITVENNDLCNKHIVTASDSTAVCPSSIIEPINSPRSLKRFHEQHTSTSNESPKKINISLKQDSTASPRASSSRTNQMMELAMQDQEITISSPVSSMRKRRINPTKLGPVLRTPKHQAAQVQICQNQSLMTPSEEWVRRTYSPSASPNSSILKRHISIPVSVSPDCSPPSTKRKRVSFLDPPVSESLLFCKKTSTGQIQRPDPNQVPSTDGLVSPRMDCGESEDMQSQGSVGLPLSPPSSSSFFHRPIFSPLQECSHPITDILERIVSLQWVGKLEQQLLNLEVTTIGQLSSLSESTIERLPFIPPKVGRLRKILENYFKEINEKNDSVQPVTESPERGEKEPNSSTSEQPCEDVADIFEGAPCLTAETGLQAESDTAESKASFDANSSTSRDLKTEIQNLANKLVTLEPNEMWGHLQELIAACINVKKDL